MYIYFDDVYVFVCVCIDDDKEDDFIENEDRQSKYARSIADIQNRALSERSHRKTTCIATRPWGGRTMKRDVKRSVIAGNVNQYRSYGIYLSLFAFHLILKVSFESL